MENIVRILEKRLQEPLPHRKLEFEKDLTPELKELLSKFQQKEGLLKKAPRICAVMIMIFERDGEIFIPFMKRPNTSRVHAGQIVFPGGGKERQDTNLIETARREAFEEIGIDVPEINVLGKLSDVYIAPSNSLVTPIVGFVAAPISYNLQKAEVVQLIEVKLSDFYKPENKTTFPITLPDGRKTTMPAFVIDGHTIWGGTARMIIEFLILCKL